MRYWMRELFSKSLHNIHAAQNLRGSMEFIVQAVHLNKIHTQIL